MDIQQIYTLFLQHPLVTTDTRNCPEGSIFFALKGEHFDGNEYIGQALEKGCAYAVGDSEKLPSDPWIIRVADSLKALQELANYHRKQLKTPVIAITGTNGKTTTKELLATALSSKYNVLYTPGNLNNHIGVPLTLLKLQPEHEWAVVEMGASHPGDIRELCLIAEPDYGLITNVGKAHLEGFGSFEGVIRTKGELYDYLRETGKKGFVNHENKLLNDILKGLDVIYYGQTPESFVWGEVGEASSYLNLHWHKDRNAYALSTHLTGAYNLENVLAAIAIASYVGVDASAINLAIAGYTPQNNRSQAKDTDKNHLIIDAYNANPTSMQAALENFGQLQAFPKMVILGDMKELGEYSPEEHRKIIEMLATITLDGVLLCGENFLACDAGHPDNWQFFPDTPELLEYLQKNPVSGYHILIKGSRINQLEKTIEFL